MIVAAVLFSRVDWPHGIVMWRVPRMWLAWRRIVVGLILIEFVGWLMMRVVVSHCCIVLWTKRDCTSASLRLTVLRGQ